MDRLRVGAAYVFPRWVIFCAVTFLIGLTMQVLPGLTVRGDYVAGSWSHNLAFADAAANINIAELGYGFDDHVTQTGVRFPLFPMMIRWYAQVFHVEPSLASFVISKLALLLGMLGLWQLIDHLDGNEQANRSIQYMIFPLLGTTYAWLFSNPEALHFAGWTWGFYFLFKRQYYACGLVTVLTVLSRPQAIFIVAPYALILLIDTLRARRSLFDTALWQAGFFACALPILVFALWMVRISTIAELPFAPITGQASHMRSGFTLPWDLIRLRIGVLQERGTLAYTWSRMFENYQLALITVSFVVMVIASIRRKLHPAFIVFSVLGIATGITTATFAVGRYAMLTWIPLALLYVVPRKYDTIVLPFLIVLSLLALLVAGFSDAAGFIL